MAENTSIEWADHTFNPWIGCTKVGPGCDHCYAEARDARFTKGGVAAHWGAGAPRMRTGEGAWGKPIEWNRQARATFGRPARVFCASLADWADSEVDPAWRADLWKLIRVTPHLQWLLLTKRRPNIVDMLPADWGWGYENVWLGHTFVNQREVDRDMMRFLEIPAAGHFASIEPMLNHIDLEEIGDGHFLFNALSGVKCHYAQVLKPAKTRKLDWVICGGESGPNARPTHPDWVRSLRDQCKRNGTPFMFKQWGAWVPAFEDVAFSSVQLEVIKTIGNLTLAGRANGQPAVVLSKLSKKAAGRTLDGVEHLEFPS